jgi:hypothetical protein
MTANIDLEKSPRIRFTKLDSDMERVFIKLFTPAILTHKLIRPNDWIANDPQEISEEVFYK